MAGWEGLPVGLGGRMGVTPCYICSRFARAAAPPLQHPSPFPPGKYAAHQSRGLLPSWAAEPARTGRLDDPAGVRAEWSTGAGGRGHARAWRPGVSWRTRALGGTPAQSDGDSDGRQLPRATGGLWWQGLTRSGAPADGPRQGIGAAVGADPALGGPGTNSPALRWDADGLGADPTRDVESCAGSTAGNCGGWSPMASPGRTWSKADLYAGAPEHGGFSRGLAGGTVGLHAGPGSELDPVLRGFSHGLAPGSSSGSPAGAASPACWPGHGGRPGSHCRGVWGVSGAAAGDVHCPATAEGRSGPGHPDGEQAGKGRRGAQAGGGGAGGPAAQAGPAGHAEPGGGGHSRAGHSDATAVPPAGNLR